MRLSVSSRLIRTHVGTSDDPLASPPKSFRGRSGGSSDYFPPTPRGPTGVLRQDVGGRKNQMAAHIGALHNDLLRCATDLIAKTRAAAGVGPNGLCCRRSRRCGCRRQWVDRTIASVDPSTVVSDSDSAVAAKYIEQTVGFHVAERQCRQMVRDAMGEIADGVKLWTRHNLS